RGGRQAGANRIRRRRTRIHRGRRNRTRPAFATGYAKQRFHKQANGFPAHLQEVFCRASIATRTRHIPRSGDCIADFDFLRTGAGVTPSFTSIRSNEAFASSRQSAPTTSIAATAQQTHEGQQDVLNTVATPHATPESLEPLELIGAKTLTCSVGIMAYNEEANIAIAIDAILRQRLASVHIKELIVVASGCTDATPSIVADIATREPRLRLIVQERREGKASAINVFIAAARSPVLLMVGADVMVKEGTIDALLTHFHDP